jgi:AbrB family looped-hinge helix DNA binding protein
MRTRLSSKGQVVLPSALRRKLGLQAGAALEAKVDGDRIILIPERKLKRKPQIERSKVTGLTIISTRGPTITSEMVYAALEEFP